jgi:hypothetical protein
MRLLIQLYRHIGMAFLVLALLVTGAYKYSRITPEEQQRIELEAGLEQLYQIEKAHFERHQSYFDPTEKTAQWPWLSCCKWEVGVEGNIFWALARADLDGDGSEGIWRIDEQSPVVYLLKED